MNKVKVLKITKQVLCVTMLVLLCFGMYQMGKSMGDLFEGELTLTGKLRVFLRAEFWSILFTVEAQREK